MSNLLFVVAPTDFRDEELFVPRREVEAAGHQVTIASTRAGTCIGVHDGTVQATIALAAVEPRDFDGVIFVGGAGARVLFDDPDAHRIAQALHATGRLVAAICVAPTILARARLLAGRRATAFSSSLPELSAAGAVLSAGDVVVDGTLVTASGPAHARRFGREIVRLLGARRADQGELTGHVAPPRA